ncbi:DUF4235 domain-containing protein [Aquipuribacter nitratireducens]|uniref:DUF4235 domain-containing protein n=1 Tax=Aquipuribacter nitratireducens TaxID=650104 RepID=A0ABW0GTA5_9MICO
MPTFAWKLMSIAFRFAALAVVNKVLLVTWKAVTGREAPEEPESPEVRAVEALVFAAISGAAVTVIRTMATRQVAARTAKKGNQLPEAMQTPYTGDETRPRRRR